MIIGLRQAKLVFALQEALGGNIAKESQQRLKRYSLMITTEGGFFLLLLGTGGITLIYLSYRDMQNTRVLKEFFSTVSHEMKTPLASIRLQVESLQEDLFDSEHKELLTRLLENSQRLELQMDKALYLASLNREETLFFEDTNLESLLKHLSYYYPELSFHISDSFFSAYIDKRAIESILKNLIENALLHGKASKIWININKNYGKIEIEIKDNGIGFKGNIKNLGKPFMRHGSSSGSGIGLYLVKTLMKKMGGEATFFNAESSGFVTILHLPSHAERVS